MGIKKLINKILVLLIISSGSFALSSFTKLNNTNFSNIVGSPFIQSKDDNGSLIGSVVHHYTDTIHPQVIDASHYSNVFGEVRNYRIFLPPSYFTKPLKRFPVIYFFHGWSQRYFGTVGADYSSYDFGDENGRDNIDNFVKDYDVIVVKMDGYDRSRNEKYNVRPYNIGPVEKSFRQFPIYFLELVDHIDENYRTIPDRNHRGISGLSMGGFMAFWVAGKYPDMISAAGSFCGSTEFEVGPKDFPVEYRHLDMYKNYDGINVRLNFGNRDFIRSYHNDLNRVWANAMENYSYKEYNAAHSTCGMSDMFNFMMRSFENPSATQGKWNHIDVYPDFKVWDYKISSDRSLPGYTVLENVDKNGFKVAVREFLPDGELMPYTNLSLLTPAKYKKHELYMVKDFDLVKGKMEERIIKSDNVGKLKINFNGGLHQVAINCAEFKPNLVIQSYTVANDDWVVYNKKLSISVALLNKGFNVATNVKVKLSSISKNVNFLKNTATYRLIKSNKIINGDQSFEFIITSDSADIIRFKLLMSDDKGNSWIDYFEIPVKKEPRVNPVFEIADGRMVTVSRAAIDSENVFLGVGNGDGIANPGESIVILIRDKDSFRRTTLFSTDKYVNSFGENVRKSDNWEKYDHVAASSKYSIPIISSDCPENHIIIFYGEYWLPVNKDGHLIKEARIEIKVTGRDKTPPLLIWGNASPDNIFRVKLSDGSGIKSVRAIFTPLDNIEDIVGAELKSQLKQFAIELNDKGINGDGYPLDKVFSGKIEENKFCLYKVEVESVDNFGNQGNEKLKENILLH